MGLHSMFQEYHILFYFKSYNYDITLTTSYGIYAIHILATFTTEYGVGECTDHWCLLLQRLCDELRHPVPSYVEVR
jgi:hypothetical protein